MSSSDRNSPCPCGSGLKAKRCCLARAAAASAPERAAIHVAHEELLDALVRFARRDMSLRLPGDLLVGLPEALLVEEEALPFLFEWMLFHAPLPDRPIAERYLQGSRRVVQRGWLQSRLAEWLTIVEVIDATPGTSVRCEDMLSGLRRDVIDVQASRSVRPRDVLLALLTDHEGACYFGSAHPLLLPPREGNDVAKTLRRALGWRANRRVTPDELREFKTMTALALAWSVATTALRDRPLPEMRNTDDDPILVTQDHYGFAPDRRRDLLAAVAAIPGADRSDDEDGAAIFVVTKAGNAMHASWDNTVVGRIVVGRRGTLTVETNSIRRADDLRAAFEFACGDIARHRARDHADVHALAERESARSTNGAKREASGIPPEVEAQLVQDFKRKHFATWPDLSLPALERMTPREAAAGSAKMRRELDVLLKSMEHGEARQPEAHRFDIGSLRRELGLPG